MNSPNVRFSVSITEFIKFPLLSYISAVLSDIDIESDIPNCDSRVSSVADEITVSNLVSPSEVTYFEFTVVVRLNTSDKFEVPPVNDASSIDIFAFRLSQLAFIPELCNEESRSPIVIVPVTFIVLSSLFILKTAVPSVSKPKFPRVVVSEAFTVLTEEKVRA